MITVRKNPNFTKWFQVISLGRLVDEVTGQSNALRIAAKHAKQQQTSVVNFLGKTVDIKEKIWEDV